MKKKILLLVKRTKQFTNTDTQNAANFLLNVFSENDVFSLPEKKQLAIINNLLDYFDTLICGIDTYKIRNKHFNESDILNHIKEKVFNLKAIQNNVVIY